MDGSSQEKVQELEHIDSPSRPGGAKSEKPSLPNWAEQHLWEIRPVRDALIFSLTVVCLALLYLFRSIFVPVGIGLLLAYLFNPIIDLAENRWSLSRRVTISLTLATLVLGGIVFAAWVGPVIADQMVALTKTLPHQVERLAQGVDGILVEQNVQLGKWVQTILSEPISAVQSLMNGTSRAFGFIGGVISSTGYLLATVVLVPIYFAVFSLHFHSIGSFLERLIPSSRSERIFRIIGQMDEAVSSFFHARLLIAAIMSGLFALGWSPLIADVPYWLVIAVVTGLLSLIPFAAGLGWLLALFLKAMEMSIGSSPSLADWIWGLGGLTAMYALIQFLEGWILTPWIQSTSLNLSAVTVMVVVLLGASTAGIVGMILAIPLAACAKILLTETVLPRLRTWAETH